MKAGNMQATWSVLKLALPAAAALLLAGCITDPYQYRGGHGGDYYYGRPSVEYRHHGYYGGYGYPAYGRSGWSFGVQYGGGYPYGYGRYGYGGYPYGYGGYGYGGWPYYYRGWPSYPPVIVHPRPRPDTEPGDDGHQGPAPWRDLDRLRNDGRNDPIRPIPSMPRTDATQPPRATRPSPRIERTPRASAGSRVERTQRLMQEQDER